MTTRYPVATSLRLSASLAALLTLAACTKPAADSALATADNTASTDMTAGLPADVQTAVAISQAMKRYPAKGDSVLTSFHLTANEFAALMQRIAADSTMSAQYRQLTQ